MRFPNLYIDTFRNVKNQPVDRTRSVLLQCVYYCEGMPTLQFSQKTDFYVMTDQHYGGIEVVKCTLYCSFVVHSMQFTNLCHAFSNDSN